MNNLVPLPYSRIAVQRLEAGLDEASIRAFLRDKDVWFETDYVVFRREGECAVATIKKTTARNSFCRIDCVEVLSQADRTRWIDDASVDTGNPSALAERARAAGIAASETLVVNGMYEHVNFIHCPQPLVIDVFDLSPPEPPRLLDMTRRLLAHRDFPAIVLNAHVQSIPALARDVTKTLLFPCAISELKRTTGALYLDERPPRQDWVLVGCARSQQIHRHFYGDDCPRIDLCPRHVFDVPGGLALMRCCMVEKRVERSGRVAFVPWGADLSLIEEALRTLLDVAREIVGPPTPSSFPG
jgi:hypothetical protein